MKEVSKKQLKKLYLKEKKTQREIAIILKVSQCYISKALKEYKIKKVKDGLENHGKRWSEKDEEYLSRSYGVDSLGSIAKHLKRTVKGVIEKKLKMDLGEAKHATEYINANELAKALGLSKSTITRYIKNKGLPAILKTITVEQKIYRIDINKFWKWCHDNLNLMQWDLYERNSLGKEPIWLDQEIKNYYKNKVKNSCSEWSKTDLCYLEYYYNNGFKTKEIAKKLGRTRSAVDARLSIMKVKRKIVNIPWKPIEVDMLIEMRNKKITFKKIADELGRNKDGVIMKYWRLNQAKA